MCLCQYHNEINVKSILLLRILCYECIRGARKLRKIAIQGIYKVLRG